MSGCINDEGTINKRINRDQGAKLLTDYTQPNLAKTLHVNKSTFSPM